MAGNDHHQIKSGWASSSSSSSSSRKGKKNSSNSSEKPKQPQRGLGVAQLEKIRLHGEFNPAAPATTAFHHYPTNYPSTLTHQLEELRSVQAPYPSSMPAAADSSSFSYSTSTPYAHHHYPNNIMMGAAGHEFERSANIGFGDSQAATTASWYPSNSILEAQHIAQPSMTRQLLISDIEDAEGKRVKKHRSKSMGSENIEEGSQDELDLELRLSL